MRQELQKRGFSGFDAGDLDTYIRWSILELGRKAPWLVMRTPVVVSVTSSTISVPASTINAAGAEGIFSIKSVVVTTVDETRRLAVQTEEYFLTNVYPQLADGVVTDDQRGAPMEYCYYEDQLWLTPPPDGTYSLTVTISKRPTNFADDTSEAFSDDADEWDEAVLLGALVRAHQRANQWNLAGTCRAELDMFLQDKLSADVMLNEETQDRVLPDDGWL